MKRSGSRTAPDWPAVFAQLARTARDPRLVRFYEAGTVSADTPLEQVPLLALEVLRPTYVVSFKAGMRYSYRLLVLVFVLCPSRMALISVSAG